MSEIPQFSYTNANSESNYELMSDPHQRQQMGLDMVNFIRTVTSEHPEVLVFLDKSARPAAYLFRSLWKELGIPVPSPEIKFVNIGREKVHDVHFAGIYSSKERQRQYRKEVKNNNLLVNSLRKTFQIKLKKVDKETGNVVRTYSRKSYLDKKVLWIVDEHSVEFVSLMTAQALFQEAFRGKYKKGIMTQSLFSDEPPWLKSDEQIGVQEENSTDILVKPLNPQSPLSYQLRAELSRLAREIADQEKAA